MSRIAFPFTGEGLSEPALAAALRLARAEGATLMPVYLALVPLRLEIDVPLRSQCEIAFALLKQSSSEPRRQRSRSTADRARADRPPRAAGADRARALRAMVVAGPDGTVGGFPEDVAWLLAHVPGELIALRPAAAVQVDVQVPIPPQSA